MRFGTCYALYYDKFSADMKRFFSSYLVFSIQRVEVKRVEVKSRMGGGVIETAKDIFFKKV